MYYHMRNRWYNTGNSTQRSVTTERGGMGSGLGGTFKREVTYVYLWLIHNVAWQKPIQHCRAIVLKLKINLKTKLNGTFRREETPAYQPPESFVLKSNLTERCSCHQVDPESDQIWVKRDNWPETIWKQPVTIKPETASHVAEPFSWDPVPPCSLPASLFPVKSFALAVCVLPKIIYLQVLDKSPFSGPGRGSLSYKNFHSFPYLAGFYDLAYSWRKGNMVSLHPFLFINLKFS